MAKKKRTTVKEVPHLPLRKWDEEKREWIQTDKLRHAHYEGDYEWVGKERTESILIPNEPFKATIKYSGFYRGRSAAGLEFTNVETKVPYVVFLTDFEKMVPKMVNGIVEGEFWFAKRGTNYGLRLYE